MRSYVIDIVWSVIDTPKLGSLDPNRETEEERGQRLHEARNRLQSITFRQY